MVQFLPCRTVVLGLVLLLGGTNVSVGQEQTQEWLGFEEAISIAETTDRFVLVDVYAPWCGWCRKMKTEVYPSEEVQSCLAGSFVQTRLNRTDVETTYHYQGRERTARQLASYLRAEEVPTTVFVSPEGKYLFHISGYIAPTHLQSVLSYLATGAYRRISFEQYRTSSSDRCEVMGKRE